MKNLFDENRYKSINYKADNYQINHYTKIPLTGKRKMVILKIQKLNKKLDDIYLPWSNPCSTSINHILEGVRLNVNTRRTSFSEILSELTRYKYELTSVPKKILKRIRIVDCAIKELKANFHICPTCKGRCGEMLGPNLWKDCETCDGFGMV